MGGCRQPFVRAAMLGASPARAACLPAYLPACPAGKDCISLLDAPSSCAYQRYPPLGMPAVGKHLVYPYSPYGGVAVWEPQDSSDPALALAPVVLPGQRPSPQGPHNNPAACLLLHCLASWSLPSTWRSTSGGRLRVQAPPSRPSGASARLCQPTATGHAGTCPLRHLPPRTAQADALLAFKQSIQWALNTLAADPLGNWLTGEDPCTAYWAGVQCDAAGKVGGRRSERLHCLQTGAQSHALARDWQHPPGRALAGLLAALNQCFTCRTLWPLLGGGGGGGGVTGAA